MQSCNQTCSESLCIITLLVVELGKLQWSLHNPTFECCKDAWRCTTLSETAAAISIVVLGNSPTLVLLLRVYSLRTQLDRWRFQNHCKHQQEATLCQRCFLLMFPKCNGLIVLLIPFNRCRDGWRCGTCSLKSSLRRRKMRSLPTPTTVLQEILKVTAYRSWSSALR